MNRAGHLRVIYTIVSLVAFAYVSTRAWTVGITYDEAWTIRVYVPVSYWDIISYDYPNANNHILNTILVKFTTSLAGTSAFAARLPNVLSFLLYAISGCWLCRSFLRPVVGFACFVLLLANPFLLDFFSLARGYGLSLGLQMASMACLAAFIRDKTPGKAIWSLAFGALAVIASFPALNFWLALLATVLCVTVANKGKSGKVIIGSLLTALVLFAIIYEPLRKLREKGSLYYGGDTGFYHDTLMSLASYTLYGDVPEHTAAICLNLALAAFGLIVAAAFYYHRVLLSVRNALLLLLTISVCSVIAQHLLLGNLYLIDRTALFFYPLFVSCLCFALNDFGKPRLANAIGLIFASAFTINFLSHANWYKTALWDFDAHTREILSLLEAQGKSQQRQVKIAYSWPFQSAIAYYFDLDSYPHLAKPDEHTTPETADYYIYLAKSLEKVSYDAATQPIVSCRKDTLMQYNEEAVFVFQRIASPAR